MLQHHCEDIEPSVAINALVIGLATLLAATMVAAAANDPDAEERCSDADSNDPTSAVFLVIRVNLAGSAEIEVDRNTRLS